MNNEQNNNTNGGINFMPMMGNDSNHNSSGSATSNENGYSIPGANLSPIGGTPSVSTESVLNPSPIPTNEPANNSNVGVMGGIAPNPIPASPVSELKMESSNPFDIGVSSSSLTSSPVLNSTILSEKTTMPMENPTSQPQEMGMNLSAMPATPTTMESMQSNNVPLTSGAPTSGMSSASDGNVVSVGKYLGHMILFSIPLVGMIMLLVKAFGSNGDKNISNYAKAQLLLVVIMVALGFVVSILFSSVMVGFGLA